MAFDKTLMCKTSTNATDGKVAIDWHYGPSADSLATISASAYFDDWVDQVNKDDYIYVVGNDGQDIRAFTNTTGVTPVTVASFITAGDLADNSVTTPKIVNANVTQAKLTPNSFDGTIAGNVADGNVIGGLLSVFKIDTPGGVTANTDVIMTHKIRVTDVKVINNAAGTASDTIQIFNGINAITNAIDISGADKTVARDGEIDNAAAPIIASSALRVTEVDGGGSDSPPTTVYVTAIRIA